MPVLLCRLKGMCLCLLSLVLPAVLVMQHGCTAPAANKTAATVPATAPVAPPVVLGPVTLWLPDETDTFVDLDTGRTLATPEDLLDAPGSMRDWARREGIDMFWQPGRLGAWLVVLDAATIPVDDSAWSRADEPADWLAMDAAAPSAGSHPIECIPSRLPAVLRIRTREGGIGIVRIAPGPASRGLSGLEIYYRMMESSSAAPLASLASDARTDLLRTLQARQGELARQILQMQAQADPDDPRLRHLESVADALARRIAALQEADRRAAQPPATQPDVAMSPATQPEAGEPPATQPQASKPIAIDDAAATTPTGDSTTRDAPTTAPTPTQAPVDVPALTPTPTSEEPRSPAAGSAVAPTPTSSDVAVPATTAPASAPACAPVATTAPAVSAVEVPEAVNLPFADMPSRFADGECLQGLPRPVILTGVDKPAVCKSDQPLLFDMHHTPMPTKLLLDGPAGQPASYNTLYVDFDNDGDFAEHAPYTATPFAGVMFPDAEPVVLYFRDVHLPRNLAQGLSSRVQIFIEQLPGWPEDVTALHPRIIPQRWAAGTLLLGDRPIAAAVIDRNWDDTFVTRAGLNPARAALPRGDYLVLALDGEPELLPCDLKDEVGSLRLVLNDYLAIDDRVYRIEASRQPEGVRLVLVPAGIPTGTLTLDAVPPAARLVLIGTKTTAVVHQPGRELRLPVDTYWSPQLGGRVWSVGSEESQSQAP